jgi:hypothetical protein
MAAGTTTEHTSSSNTVFAPAPTRDTTRTPNGSFYASNAHNNDCLAGLPIAWCLFGLIYTTTLLCSAAHPRPAAPLTSRAAHTNDFLGPTRPPPTHAAHLVEQHHLRGRRHLRRWLHRHPPLPGNIIIMTFSDIIILQNGLVCAKALPARSLHYPRLAHYHKTSTVSAQVSFASSSPEWYN